MKYLSFSESETWHLISQGGSEFPTARHRHTAVLHDNAMWVHGGMTDLQEKADFWRFDFGMYYFSFNRQRPKEKMRLLHTCVS